MMQVTTGNDQERSCNALFEMVVRFLAKAQVDDNHGAGQGEMKGWAMSSLVPGTVKHKAGDCKPSFFTGRCTRPNWSYFHKTCLPPDQRKGKRKGGNKGNGKGQGEK